MSEIAKTPKPPYYAVIFTSERTDGDNQYAEMADEMLKLTYKTRVCKVERDYGFEKV
ncbi:hypothetical protein D3C78_983770 [compost metagenome]